MGPDGSPDWIWEKGREEEGGYICSNGEHEAGIRTSGEPLEQHLLAGGESHQLYDGNRQQAHLRMIALLKLLLRR